MPPSKRVVAAEAQLELVTLLSRSAKGTGAEAWSWIYRLNRLVSSLADAESLLREVAEDDPWAAEQVSAARLQTTEALKRTNKLLSEVKRCLV